MATNAEILESLNKLQIKNFLSIIEISKEQIVQRKVQFQRLKTFTTNRANRIQSLVNAVADKLAEDAVVDEYTIFQNTSSNIGGQSDDLDELSGMIHQTVYGNVKAAKLRQRELSELSFQQDKISNFISNLEELESDLTSLTSDLNAASS